jgi:hypothetical protein
MGKATFAELLQNAARNAAIYDFHHLEFLKARSRGLKPKAARGEASKVAAVRFELTRRSIERIVDAWPAQEGELKVAADSDYEPFDRAAKRYVTVTEWFSADELKRHDGLSVPELENLAFPRAVARVAELQVKVNELNEKNQELEIELKKYRKEEVLTALNLNAYSGNRKG